MTTTIHFNTGRKYARDGQRISATLHDDGVVTFMDHSRMIDGELTLTTTTFDRAGVMHMYDSGLYRGSQRSSRDGMQSGGCNLWAEVAA